MTKVHTVHLDQLLPHLVLMVPGLITKICLMRANVRNVQRDTPAQQAAPVLIGLLVLLTTTAQPAAVQAHHARLVLTQTEPLG